MSGQYQHGQYANMTQGQGQGQEMGSMSTPNAGGNGGGKAPNSGNKPTYAKRGKITIVACVPCRKRKTKCDGKRPHCSQCTARDGQCSYDMTDDQRKLTYLRDNVEQLQTKAESLQQLLLTVQNSSEAEAAEIFRRIRQPGTNVQFVAEQVQAGQSLYGVGRRDPSRSLSIEQGQSPATDPITKAQQYDQLVSTLMQADTDSIHTIIQRMRAGEAPGGTQQQVLGLHPARPRQPQPLLGPIPDASKSLEAAFSRHDQTFGMVKGAEMSHTSIGSGTEFVDERMHHPWTNVTQDQDLIDHLLTLYFTWQHCFFQNFPEQLFRNDMKAGRTKFCSPTLVNAICSAGCFLSNRDICRKDFGNGVTLMDKFYDEAVHGLEKASHQSTLTTTASLYLISYVDGTRGRLSSLWMFSGRSVLMATDLELHLRPLKQRKKTPAPTEEGEEERRKEGEARTHAFWGCFHVDQTTSFTLGRLPLFNINGITCEPPLPDELNDDEPWTAYELELPDRPGMRASAFASCAALSKLVNSTLVMFFAPTVAMSGALLLAEYEKYLEWYRGLNPRLADTRNAVPHIISLHMYYHTALLLLFRPFLKAKIDYSDVVPREVCREAANMISDLWKQHRHIYGLSGIYMFQVHCLLTACTIHIINVPTISATRHLTTACNIFQELVPRNGWARSALTILRGLAEKWRLVLPLEVEEAMYRDVGGPPAASQGQYGSMLPMESDPDFAREYPARPDPMAAQLNLMPNIDYRLQQQTQRDFLQSHPQYSQKPLDSPEASSSKRGTSENESSAGGGVDASKRQRLDNPALRDMGLPAMQNQTQTLPAMQTHTLSAMQSQQMPQPRQAQMIAQQSEAELAGSYGNLGVNFGTGFGMGLAGYPQRVQSDGMRSASSHMYNPMAGNPAPLLVPVMRSQSSKSDPPVEGMNDEKMMQQGQHMAVGGQAVGRGDAGMSMRDKVEGMSFGDDWRDMWDMGGFGGPDDATWQ